MRVEWRPLDASTPPDDAAEPVLVEAIRAEIAASGPVTFARFMERALYEPGLGYYAIRADRATRTGDFLTAPELHPIFGWTLALQLDEMWRRMGRPPDFELCEYGAGTGALFLALLDGLVRAGSPLAERIRYQPIDLAAQLDLISERLSIAGRESLLQRDARERPLVGCAMANEFADALPVHRVIRSDGRLREIYVDWRDDAFSEVMGDLSDARLAEWFSDAGVELADGQRAEANLALIDWMAELAGDLERGYAIVIDYGSGSRELYGPDRPTGTLRAFSGQNVSSDVLGGAGRRDITAHVDFDALDRAARKAGLEVLGRRRVAEFLLASGLDEVYAAARDEANQDWDAALLLRSSVRRLIDPAALGGYQVAVLGRNVEAEPPLLGLRT